jgi:hypothetical protein
MARDEAKVKVRLDTKQAKGELRGLTQEGAKAAGRVGAGIRSTLSRGIGAVGLGVGIGAGMAALRGATQSGLTSIITQTLGGLGQRFAQGTLGAENLAKAAGGAQALQEILGGYSQVVGHRDPKAPLPRGMISDFQQRERYHTETARGAGRILRDPQFRNEAAQWLDNKTTKVGELFDAVYDLFKWGYDDLTKKLGR